MNGVLKTLLENDYFVGCAMAIIVFALTFLLKLPIKAITKKIKNERVRKAVNSVILIIPFLLGLLAEFLFGYYYLHVPFTGMSGLSYGTGGISMYAVVERFFKKNAGIQLDNPFNGEDGEAVKKLVEDIQQDGKIDAKDASAVDEFYKTISKYRDNK